jgi:broad specificity phosphatase PhoE
MNNLKKIENLNNRYFILRHGESKANIQNIILSNPENGISDFGLTEKGVEQVKSTMLGNNDLDENTIIYSSDFARAKETAEIAKNILKINEIHFTKFLRERFFGNFEETDNTNYDNVWKHDKNDPNHEIEEVESVNQVLDRATKLILTLEEKYQNKKILLVSHGDTLQILETGFRKSCSSTHRKIKSLETAELRELKITLS